MRKIDKKLETSNQGNYIFLTVMKLLDVAIIIDNLVELIFN